MINEEQAKQLNEETIKNLKGIFQGFGKLQINLQEAVAASNPELMNQVSGVLKSMNTALKKRDTEAYKKAGQNLQTILKNGS